LKCCSVAPTSFASVISIGVVVALGVVLILLKGTVPQRLSRELQEYAFSFGLLVWMDDKLVTQDTRECVADFNPMKEDGTLDELLERKPANVVGISEFLLLEAYCGSPTLNKAHLELLIRQMVEVMSYRREERKQIKEEDEADWSDWYYYYCADLVVFLQCVLDEAKEEGPQTVLVDYTHG
jgi:hypothetical protein